MKLKDRKKSSTILVLLLLAASASADDRKGWPFLIIWYGTGRAADLGTTAWSLNRGAIEQNRLYNNGSGGVRWEVAIPVNVGVAVGWAAFDRWIQDTGHTPAERRRVRIVAWAFRVIIVALDLHRGWLNVQAGKDAHRR